MTYANAPAVAGWEWLYHGAGMLRRQAAAAAIMAVALAVLAVLPGVGGLLAALLTPALYGGLIALLSQHAAVPAGDAPMRLLDGLRDPARRRSLLILALPLLATGVVLALAMYVLLGREFLAGDVAGGNLALARLGIGTLLLPVLVVAGVFFALICLFFAIPRVMLRGADAVPAIRQSIDAATANLAPLIVLVLALVVLGLLLAAISIPLVGTIGATIVMGLVLHPLLAAAMCAGEREVFAREE